MPPNHLNPHKAPDTEVVFVPEQNASAYIPTISHSIFGWLFAIFCLLQFLPGYHFDHLGFQAKPKNIPVGFCNFAAIASTLDSLEHIDAAWGRERFMNGFHRTHVALLQTLALTSYFILNLRLLRKQLTIRPITMMFLAILMNTTWYCQFFIEGSNAGRYPLIGLYLQSMLLTGVSFLAWSRLKSERDQRSWYKKIMPALINTPSGH